MERTGLKGEVRYDWTMLWRRQTNCYDELWGTDGRIVERRKRKSNTHKGHTLPSSAAHWQYRDSKAVRVDTWNHPAALWRSKDVAAVSVAKATLPDHAAGTAARRKSKAACLTDA